MPEEPPKKTPDIVLLHSKTEDGKGVRVVRGRPGKIEVGEIRPLVSGQPVGKGEILALQPREKTPWVCDVADSVTIEATTTESTDANGPAQVATEAYRASWERIFGEGVPRHDLN